MGEKPTTSIAQADASNVLHEKRLTKQLCSSVLAPSQSQCASSRHWKTQPRNKLAIAYVYEWQHTHTKKDKNVHQHWHIQFRWEKTNRTSSMAFISNKYHAQFCESLVNDIDRKRREKSTFSERTKLYEKKIIATSIHSNRVFLATRLYFS